MLVVKGQSLDDDHLADRFRRRLKRAGINRPELFDRSTARLRLRVHDLRATFVTVSLANGKTETWVADRTGHKSSDMINEYRRQARTWAELNLGELAPLDRAIPELARHRKTGPTGSGGGGRRHTGGRGRPSRSRGRLPHGIPHAANRRLANPSGAEENRTLYLLTASQTLSQMSYGPKPC